MNLPISIESISAKETLALRGKILRPHHPLMDSVYPSDEDSSAGHFGAVEYRDIVEFNGKSDSLNGHSMEKLIHGVATVYPELPNSLPPGVVLDLAGLMLDSVWRLRGMATDGEVRGQGLGGRLVRACIDHVAKNGGKMIWANARTPALKFYRREGFEVMGAEYTLPGIGPHYFIVRSISDEF